MSATDYDIERDNVFDRVRSDEVVNVLCSRFHVKTAIIVINYASSGALSYHSRIYWPVEPHRCRAQLDATDRYL